MAALELILKDMNIFREYVNGVPKTDSDGSPVYDTVRCVSPHHHDYTATRCNARGLPLSPLSRPYVRMSYIRAEVVHLRFVHSYNRIVTVGTACVAGEVTPIGVSLFSLCSPVHLS